MTEERQYLFCFLYFRCLFTPPTSGAILKPSESHDFMVFSQAYYILISPHCGGLPYSSNRGRPHNCQIGRTCSCLQEALPEYT